MNECSECGEKDCLCIGKMNPENIFRCECGNVFTEEKKGGV